MKTRLMIVDDHEVVRMGLRAALEVEPDFKLAEYRKVPLQRLPLFVSPEELQKGLAQLQDSMALYYAADISTQTPNAGAPK